MTQNQIAFQKLQEEKRMNLANEEVARRNASSQEKIAGAQIANAVTGGIKNVASSIPIIGGLF
nr:hypothetical protein [Chicken picobirnavirus]